ncbi:MAG TPA: hypothetical protein VGM82_09720 [Gemmatimonadaceae bacterium]
MTIPMISVAEDARRAGMGAVSLEMQPSRILFRAATLVVALSTSAIAQRADPALLTAIRSIKAIDNHAHPPALVAAGQKDPEFDALPCDPLEPTDPALSSRPENPRFLAAWKALYGYKYNDTDPARPRAARGETEGEARAG